MAAARTILPPLLALAAILLLWEAITRALSVPAYELPPPSLIALAAIEHWDDLLRAALITARAAVVGFTLSAILGMIGGVLLGSSRRLERALYPYAVFLQTVPIISIAPLFVIWFGPGLRAVSLAAFIASVFPVIVNTLAGIRSVDLPLRDLFRLYGASRRATLLKLELPSALPNIVAGLRVAAGLAVIGTVTGELFAGISEGAAGLGILVVASHRQLRTDLLFAAVVLASLLGLVLFGAVNLIGYML